MSANRLKAYWTIHRVLRTVAIILPTCTCTPINTPCAHCQLQQARLSVLRLIVTDIILARLRARRAQKQKNDPPGPPRS